MIDIIDHVVKTLAPLKLTVAFQALPTGSQIPNQYITFMEINAKAALEVADKEFETERLIQVNVWSRTNYHNLAEGVKKMMESAGYERTYEYDVPYNDGDSHFNKVLRFVFFDEY